jgi:serine/threonine protein kinase
VRIDGYEVGEQIHAGAMGTLYRVHAADRALVMKIPRDSPEAIISYETETTILPMLKGPHVPHFVAAGDLTRSPYLVTEWVEGVNLESLRDPDVPRVGAAIADALHSLHQQDVIHHDVKPDNIIVKPDGVVALVDFGFAHHARFPDLLDEETRAAGSAPYISPEQLAGTRNDPRSDLFSFGVVLYEMATGRLPFGDTGMQARLWMDPAPPMVEPALQEVILRCLEVNPDLRYQSAGHVAFDLRNPGQVRLTPRATKSRQAGLIEQTKRWWNARERRPKRVRLSDVPIVMIAVDTTHPDDETHHAIRRVTRQILGVSSEFRLICVSIVDAENKHLDHMIRLRHWVESLRLPAERLSLHVLESDDPADALVKFARLNNVDLIVIGVRRAWSRSVASTVVAHAHCSVHIVRV